jgi:hypothetical protein
MKRTCAATALIWCWLCALLHAGVGDPQLGTQHPYYPGEWHSSSFERLSAAQAKLYKHVTQRDVTSEQDKVLAAWLWRNTHYWHGEPGAEDLWGEGFTRGPDRTSREYWGGLYGHGFALCGTTHAQWVAEMQALLGHNRARTVGTSGHNSFEVYLQDGDYAPGKWVLLDHDLSTVVFDPTGQHLLSIREVTANWKQLTAHTNPGNRIAGWLPSGLHADDGAAFREFNVAEYFSGYAGGPPIVHLRRGERLRRYAQPGLDDGKTFVFWGRNYNTAGIPGPERSRTWVNQPETMFRSTTGAGFHTGQARYANAVYTYEPDFSSGDYREGIVAESDSSVTLEFVTPYIIAATPAGDDPWDIYQPGCKNGLVIRGQGGAQVDVSVDRGRTWHAVGRLAGMLDATDHVKGFRQYWLRISAPAKSLVDSKLSIRTVCQMNSSLIPRLLPGENVVMLGTARRALVSAGPTIEQARAHLVAGDFNSPQVTLAVAAPRDAEAIAVHAAAHLRSGNPPNPQVNYQIDYSLDQGRSWLPLVADWKITRRGDEPDDFWSQSFVWGSATLPRPRRGLIHVRFRNSGGKAIARAEMHLEYATAEDSADACAVTFAVGNERDPSAAVRALRAIAPAQGGTFTVDAGPAPVVRWVELSSVKQASKAL